MLKPFLFFSLPTSPPHSTPIGALCPPDPPLPFFSGPGTIAFFSTLMFYFPQFWACDPRLFPLTAFLFPFLVFALTPKKFFFFFCNSLHRPNDVLFSRSFPVWLLFRFVHSTARFWPVSTPLLCHPWTFPWITPSPFFFLDIFFFPESSTFPFLAFLFAFPLLTLPEYHFFSQPSDFHFS